MFCINCDKPLNEQGNGFLSCDECNAGMTYPTTTSIEQAHIDADEHARTCDDKNCGECYLDNPTEDRWWL